MLEFNGIIRYTFFIESILLIFVISRYLLYTMPFTTTDSRNICEEPLLVYLLLSTPIFVSFNCSILLSFFVCMNKNIAFVKLIFMINILSFFQELFVFHAFVHSIIDIKCKDKENNILILELVILIVYSLALLASYWLIDYCEHTESNQNKSKVIPSNFVDIEVIPDSFECCICLESEKNEVIKLNCDHLFHKDCIVKWYDVTTDNALIFHCPICRNNCMDK